ncbi:MAG: PAS domain-containing protein [Bacteroidota bacterium]|jgi:PAS domain S-box-containing protein|nr:PAS domain-containing protein [Bacteroidota bacterium]
MSELIENSQHIPEGLMTFARGIMTRTDVIEKIRLHRDVIDRVTPYQAMVVLDSLMAEGYTVAEVKDAVGKILNMFHRGLSSYEWDVPAGDHFLNLLMLENREAEARIATLRELTKRFFRGEGMDDDRLRADLLEAVRALEPYELHYIKKENILFPYIEKTFPSYGCLKVMWAFHDDFRQCLRNLREMLSGPELSREGLNTEMGRLFFTVLPVIFREEHIVFPVALQAIPPEGWDEMLGQGAEAGWCYISGPEPVNRKREKIMHSDLTDLVTGALSAEQIVLMLEHLPVDITYVDENDTVRYFSGEKHRIFPRSKAIIGREVQNCHPPDSVEVVERILDAFRNREKDHADFWINMRGRFIHIRYFALYDTAGNYRGTIEVSQDVTEIRALEGEQRLLDWK